MLIKQEPNSWMKVISDILVVAAGNLNLDAKRVVKTQRDNDKYLMNMVHCNEGKLEAFQRCRFYMESASLADICTPNNDKVDILVYQGKQKKIS